MRDLKQGNAAIEERARSELGMIKEDEVFYQVIDQPFLIAQPNQFPEVSPIPETPASTQPISTQSNSTPATVPSTSTRTVSPLNTAP